MTCTVYYITHRHYIVSTYFIVIIKTIIITILIIIDTVVKNINYVSTIASSCGTSMIT